MKPDQILVEFRRYGIQPTSQRIEIAGILLEKPQHLSAEQIIDRLRESGSRVSKATVYNTLNLFAARGIVKERIVDPERRFYDSNTSDHHHFFNVDTGVLTDIADDAIEFARLPITPDAGHVESVEVVIKVRNEPPEKGV